MHKTPLTNFLGPKYWPTWVGIALLRIASLLPLPLVAVIGQGFGILGYLVIGSRRKIALHNIRVCFPELSRQQCQAINFEHFRLAGQALFTMPMIMWVSKPRLERMIDFSGREHYLAAIEQGKNIIVLAPHFIALDIGGIALAMERHCISMYQYMKNALSDEIVKRSRLRFGGELFERKEPLRALLRSVKQGKPFIYLPDQDAGRKGIFVPFFHELASTTPALGKFAQTCNALVIPCQTRIKPWGRGYQISMDKPLEGFPKGDDHLDTARMNRVIADMIRKAPSQYLWVHKRFKTRPPNQPSDFYSGI